MLAMQAIEFVQMQRDDELWELLISLALESPALTGGGAFLSPARLTLHAHYSPCLALLFPPLPCPALPCSSLPACLLAQSALPVLLRPCASLLQLIPGLA